MKTWKKVVLGIVATPFVLAALLGVVYVYQDSIKKDVKEGYNQKIETGGDLESKYLLGGDL